MSVKAKLALGAAAFLVFGTIAAQIPRWRAIREIDSAMAAGKIEEQRMLDMTRTSAEAGDAQSQYNLAVFYEKGFGMILAKDENQAVHWYRLAAGQGHAGARLALDARRTAPSSGGK